MQQATPKHRSWSIFLLACMLLASGCVAGAAPGTEEWLSGDDGSAELAQAAQPLKKVKLCPVPGTLGYHVAQSKGKIPWLYEFQYDPPGQRVAFVDGTYDRKTETFAWTETYDPQHYRTTTTVQGTVQYTGTGTLVNYTVTTTDKHGMATVEEVEETWANCAVTRRTKAPDAPESDWRYHHGNYDGAGYTYDEQQAPSLWYEDPDNPGIPYANGTLDASNLTWIESFSGYWVSEEFSYGHTRKGDADGHVVTDWARAGGDYYQSGTDELLLDGSVQRTFVMDGSDDAVEVELTVDYSGNGAGTMHFFAYDPGTDDWLPVTCTLSLTATTCTETCPHLGNSKSCPWWVMH